MIRIIKATLIAAMLLTLVISAGASVLVSGGYACSDTAITTPPFGFIGGFDLLPSGNYLVNDGYTIREVNQAGADVTTFYTFSSPVSGSFARYLNGTLYFGESTYGSSKIYSMPAAGGNATELLSLPGNFDMDFHNGIPYITAGSTIYQLNNDNTVDGIATVNGYSGPLAFDSEGNLYYSPSLFPKSTSVLKWTSDQVAGAVGSGLLQASDAQMLTGISGSYGFAFDNKGRLLISNNSGAKPIIQRWDGKSLSTIATFDVAGTQYPAVTFLRCDQSTGDIYAGVAYYAADFSASYNYITKLTYVPEPSSMLALCSLIGLVGSLKLLRFSGK